MAGYSGTPLPKKPGLKPGTVVCTVSAPEGYLELLGPEAPALDWREDPLQNVDFIHFFATSHARLEAGLSAIQAVMARNGMVWVSWPKKASGVASDITEDTIRDVALPLGLVDVKVCAVDEVWSGLKLVIRKELR